MHSLLSHNRVRLLETQERANALTLGLAVYARYLDCPYGERLADWAVLDPFWLKIKTHGKSQR
jgi:hypothetical protein